MWRRPWLFSREAGEIYFLTDCDLLQLNLFFHGLETVAADNHINDAFRVGLTPRQPAKNLGKVASPERGCGHIGNKRVFPMITRLRLLGTACAGAVCVPEVKF